jgi:Bifunctional DNA primase/polymerase, N-terminal/Family of unknown function (DUF5906)
MSRVDDALSLAAQGFWIFPIVAGEKAPPLETGWQKSATRDPRTILEIWGAHPALNIGIFTSKFQDDKALLVIDVDNKGEKHGDQELLRLELAGRDLPETYEHTTPTGGRHLVYLCDTPMRQGTNVLAPGLDIRSRGGYIVACGSTVERGTYTANGISPVNAPAWLIERCSAVQHTRGDPAPSAPIDEIRSSARGRHYLLSEAPIAIEGQGGDQTTFKVACHLKDFGLSGMDALSLMREHWNERCVPPWAFDELVIKVHNAYEYGTKAPGSNTPEAAFAEPYKEERPESASEPKCDTAGATSVHKKPLEKFNDEYAFVIAGGGAHILWETTDLFDRYHLEHLSLGAFHAAFAPEVMMIGKREEQTSQLWLKWKGRRAYEGLVFMPGQQAPARFFNLWKGFAYEPADTSSHSSVEAFCNHLLFNVCHGEKTLAHWLTAYFADLIQRPWNKPLVALVLRGARGVGKNALVERVGALLGHHFLLTSNRRYLVGNFNGHLENCLLFALDEAFWSGDKQAEGTLKDLITGREHVIEHKGKEPYTVNNKTRIVIIGNEDWLVPAAYDERRFAVFDVGDGNKQDREFFDGMRRGMDQGGYKNLLRYLQDYDCTGCDINQAPSTQGLNEQKLHSLDPFHQWWLACLEDGRMGEFELGTDTISIECERFKGLFRRDAQERQIRSRLLEPRSVRRLLKLCVKSATKVRMAKRDGHQPYAYRIPPLLICRQEWDAFMGYTHKWLEERTE